MHMERCANCRKPHEPGKFTAVYIKGNYFCKPSCCNQYKPPRKKQRTVKKPQ